MAGLRRFECEQRRKKQRVVDTLRRESRAAGAGALRDVAIREKLPALIGLADELRLAVLAGRRRFTYQGVQIEIRHGLCTASAVLPSTGEVLVSVLDV
jgi:hypothetical protein